MYYYCIYQETDLLGNTNSQLSYTAVNFGLSKLSTFVHYASVVHWPGSIFCDRSLSSIFELTNIYSSKTAYPFFGSPCLPAPPPTQVLHLFERSSSQHIHSSLGRLQAKLHILFPDHHTPLPHLQHKCFISSKEVQASTSVPHWADSQFSSSALY
jgi:hypothetical protein